MPCGSPARKELAEEYGDDPDRMRKICRPIADNARNPTLDLQPRRWRAYVRACTILPSGLHKKVRPSPIDIRSPTATSTAFDRYVLIRPQRCRGIDGRKRCVSCVERQAAMPLRTARTITESRPVGMRLCDLGCGHSWICANRRRSIEMIDEGAIRQRWEAVGCQLDERGRRLFAAGEMRTAGWGGLAVVLADDCGFCSLTINRRRVMSTRRRCRGTGAP